MFPFPAACVGRLLVFLVFAGLAGVPAATAQSLSLADAEDLALARDAGLEEIQARQEALLDSAVAESQLPDPELLFGAANVPVDSFDLDREPMTQVQVGLRQRFPAGDTLALKRSRLEVLAEATTAVEAGRRREVLLSLRHAWIEAAWRAEAMELVAAERAWYRELEGAVVSAYASGRRRQDELIRIQLEIDGLEEEIARLRETRAPWEAAVIRWLGEDASRAALDRLPELPPLPPGESASVRLESHPVLAERAEAARAEAIGVDLAREAYKPSWMLDVRYGLRDSLDEAGRDRSDMLSAMLSFELPIFTGDRQDRRVSAARASERAARRQLEDRRRMLAAELAAARESHQRLGDRIVLFDSQILPSAADYVEATLLAYQNDLAPFDELVRAEKTLLDARLDALRLKADRLSAHAKLAYLVGDSP
ncbi:MAG: TolC family protein [Gammaproteobacteria bacterium]